MNTSDKLSELVEELEQEAFEMELDEHLMPYYKVILATPADVLEQWEEMGEGGVLRHVFPDMEAGDYMFIATAILNMLEWIEERGELEGRNLFKDRFITHEEWNKLIEDGVIRVKKLATC